MKAVYGLYPDAATAQQAVDRLRAEGVVMDRITILTPYPIEGSEFFERDARTAMWWYASLGGVAGLSAATGLLWVGETSWPLNVGGLPTFAWWPNLIIMFEMTMLGAILATVATLVVSARLGRGSVLHDSAVSDGLILVGVEQPSATQVPMLRRALEAPSGPAAVRAID